MSPIFSSFVTCEYLTLKLSRLGSIYDSFQVLFVMRVLQLLFIAHFFLKMKHFIIHTNLEDKKTMEQDYVRWD